MRHSKIMRTRNPETLNPLALETETPKIRLSETLKP